VIASTHRDLKARAAEEKFREDLYYRLSVFTIQLPPLRDRGEDIPTLVTHYLRRFSRELARDIRDIAPEALDRLRAYNWPGNIRELQSILKQALLQASGTVLLPGFLPEVLGSASAVQKETVTEEDPGLKAFIRHRLTADATDLYAQVHGDVDRIFLTLVLDYAQGSQRQAAKMLGIARQTSD
jgi:two-component system nitrogen regulation response regulator GlnG